MWMNGYYTVCCTNSLDSFGYTYGIYYGSCWCSKQDDLKRKYSILFKYLPFYIKACLKVVKISLLLIIAYENISIFLSISVKISLLRF